VALSCEEHMSHQDHILARWSVWRATKPVPHPCGCARLDMERDQLSQVIWARQKSTLELHRGLEAGLGCLQSHGLETMTGRK